MELSDEQIQKMAKERVAFKQHAAAYVIVNGMLAGIWLASGSWEGGFRLGGFWPIWTLLFWGVGLAFHGWNAYSDGETGMQAREEAKLRQKYR